MDECARLVKAQAPARPRPEPVPADPPVYRRAAMNLEALSSRVLRDPDTVEAMAQLANERSRIEPAGALTFACLLYLSDRSEGAQFWWQFAAGAGVTTAAYCLYLHHTQYSEDDMARFWYRQARRAHAAPRVHPALLPDHQRCGGNRWPPGHGLRPVDGMELASALRRVADLLAVQP
ncbi:hypothetical protein [Streptomyces kanasensis]|uniref:hypothetical protein n=1 Tax=Streptomyces kanasensis TaxID=936756 RepID=UPI0038179D5B